MGQVRLSIARGGANAMKDVVQAAGAAGTLGTDSVDVNIDQTRMTKAEAVFALETIKQRVSASKWPMA